MAKWLRALGQFGRVRVPVRLLTAADGRVFGVVDGACRAAKRYLTNKKSVTNVIGQFVTHVAARSDLREVVQRWKNPRMGGRVSFQA